MDSINERIAGILGDEKSMEQIRNILGSLQGEKCDDKSPPGDAPDISGMLSALMKGKSLISGKNKEVELLRALEPFLSGERKKKIDEAVKILKLLDMLPLLRESGILDSFLGGDSV